MGSLSLPEVVQPCASWLRLGGTKALGLLVESSYLSGCSLSLQTAYRPEGPWTERDSITSANQHGDQLVLLREDASAFLPNLFRWVLEIDDPPPANPYQACFRIVRLDAAASGGCPR